MKKLAIALLTAMLACSVLAQETEFPDIPDNHWAASAVSEIADLGIVIGFPDGTFRGNTAFTRYQAALVISRTLDVLEANIEAATAMTDEDIASLRNALQELASDVASQGVRLAAAESAIASISDDVIANSARLDELEAGVGTGTGNGDPAVLRDLQNQIASQRVALDTAQAQAEAAEALANDALDAANSAASRARQNADEISALNQLVQDLSDRFDELAIQSGRSDLATGVTDRIARTEADIANIREFVILLRRDQVALRDRVSALEAADADQAAAVADLEERVAAIENNPLGLSGSISASLRVERLSGAGEAFDVDRAFGLGLPAEMDASVFSTGNGDEDGDGKVEDIAGERAQDRADIDGTGTDGVSTDLSLSIDNAFGLAGAGAFNDFGVVVNFELNEITAATPGGGEVTFYAFQLDDFTVTFDPIGADALSFQFGEEITAEFTPYVLDIDANDSVGGFVATIGSPDMLAFLDPTFQVVYANPAAGEFLRGVRATVTPLDGFFLGGSFVQEAINASDKDDVNDDNVTTTVWGVDAALGLSIFEIAGEYATASEVNAATDATTDLGDVFYVVVDVDGLPFLRDVSANYRDVDAAWDDDTDRRLMGDTGDYPFAADQTGFGVSAGFDLFILGVDGYFDSYAITDPQAADVSAFGVDVTAPLFSGFALTGYYHSASIDGTTVDNLSGGQDADENVVVAGVARNGNDYETEFGVTLAHDGTADNALITGLNLEFGYEQSEADFSVTTLSASADYDLNVSIAALTPYVSYTSVSDTDTAEAGVNIGGVDDTTTLKVGTGLSTQPLGVIFAPSLEAAVNYRTTDHTMSDAAGDEFTATEMQWSVGLALNEFLFDNSTLVARYGSYTGTNVSTADLGTEGATDISAGDANNGLTQTVSGYELAWMYYGLEVAYGVYESDEGTGAGSTAGQVFAINYSVNF